MTTQKCYLNAVGILCAAGDSLSAVESNLRSQTVNLMRSARYSTEQHSLPLGLYQGSLPKITLKKEKWQSRNNQFALAALEQMKIKIKSVIEKYGADRIAVIVGTSTSGIAESETAIKQWVEQETVPKGYDYGVQEMAATAEFVAEILGIKGPVYGISTACSSGAKALASAKRLIKAGICDAVIAGGVDTLCHLTVQGFLSLEAVSDEPCNPFSKNRKGINIGEGAALFVVSAEREGVELVGSGEGSDAHHISAPEPTGAGAKRCMRAALENGGIKAEQVGYVNLHGTATSLNDQMESQAMHEVFGEDTFCSSTKPFTGHTLGAAGAVEAAICWLMLHEDSSQNRGQLLPVQLWDGIVDPALPAINLVKQADQLEEKLDYVLSNSFAFGGNNISLLLGRIQ